MKSTLLILLSALLLTACSDSCNNKTVKVPDLPYLGADSLHQFRVGDRFLLATSTNSCCMYCWQADSTLQPSVPESPLLRFIETIEDPSDPDCAGCSNFYYRVYECVAPGSDTLRYAVMPMGGLGGASGCEEVNPAQVDSSYFRNYIFTIR
ncbi:MAG TPA: hypothetical protein PKE07_06910 [Lacibacter sp.]|nr:hypothetical protein [Lacibacter sp.]HMO90158.1 hypothetical protein [Lacibacter sp.]